MRCVAQDAEARGLEALTIWQCKGNQARGLRRDSVGAMELPWPMSAFSSFKAGPHSLRLQPQSSPSQGRGLQEALILRMPEGRVTLNSSAAGKV